MNTYSCVEGCTVVFCKDLEGTELQAKGFGGVACCSYIILVCCRPAGLSCHA